MDRQTALERAGEVIVKMAESLTREGMHSVKEKEIKEIAESLQD